MNKNKLILPVMALAALVGGAATGIASFASAATTDSTTTVTTAAQVAPAQGQFDRTKGGHVGHKNGVRETLLTGDVAAKVTAAALAAQPSATIDRVENDAEGAVYEAHMTKADGSRVTVKFDAAYNVTTTETGR